jgi:hypothetical protein
MKDFTFSAYKALLSRIIDKNYFILTFKDYIYLIKKNNLDIHSGIKQETLLPQKIVIFRHDVDRIPANSLRMAHLENKMGIRSTYFFRYTNNIFKPDIIKEISLLGHEIGYHYEDLVTAKGDYEKAISLFKQHLNAFREIINIQTICMHGSPLSKWNNINLWDKYKYHDYGIILEPYIDIDYSEFFYITDTGRRWNNSTSNIRDTVNSTFNITLKNTKHFISLIEENELPNKLIINIHPHRWFESGFMWYREFIIQNAKNVIKKGINTFRR